MRILIPVDDSECSWDAVKSLATREWASPVEVRIITVVPFSNSYLLPLPEETQRTKRKLENCGQQLVDLVITQLKKSIGHADISGSVLEGGATESILLEISEWKPDLVIMGSHGRKGFLRFLFGSVAEAVAKQAPCKVEIIVEQSDQSPEDF